LEANSRFADPAIFVVKNVLCDSLPIVKLAGVRDKPLYKMVLLYAQNICHVAGS